MNNKRYSLEIQYRKTLENICKMDKISLGKEILNISNDIKKEYKNRYNENININSSLLSPEDKMVMFYLPELAERLTSNRTQNNIPKMSNNKFKKELLNILLNCDFNEWKTDYNKASGVFKAGRKIEDGNIICIALQKLSKSHTLIEDIIRKQYFDKNITPNKDNFYEWKPILLNEIKPPKNDNNDIYNFRR